MSTFRINTVKPGSYVYLDLANLDRQLKLSASRQPLTRDGVRSNIVRTSLVLTTPERIVNADCTDACGPSMMATRLVRFETSAASVSKADLLLDIKEITALIEQLDETAFFDGVPPAPNLDLTITVI